MGKRELKYGKIRGWLCRLDYTFRIFNILSFIFSKFFENKTFGSNRKKNYFCNYNDLKIWM